MKKRFSAILMALMMILSLCSFTAFAGNTSLELTHYNIITNNIRLEFSNDVNNVTASLKSTDNNAIAVTPEEDSTNAKVWNLKLSEKMDITKQYILDFTATGSDIATLTATKLIKFTVYANDNFDSYTQLSDLDANYTNVSGYSFAQTKISAVTGYSLVEDANGGKRLSLEQSSNNGFWTKKLPADHKKKYYNFEADFEDKGNGNFFALYHDIWIEPKPSLLISVNNNTNNISNKLDFNNAYILNNILFADISNSNYAKNGTYAFSLNRNADDTKDVYSISYNGNLLFSKEGTLSIRGSTDSFYYILANYWGSKFYLDNYKLYAYSMEDYAPIKLDYINVTTKGITVAYNGNVKEGYNVELLKADGTNIATTTVKNNVINVIPTERLDLSKAYILKVSNVSDGVVGKASDISKLITFDVIVDDDFDSYNTLTDVEANFVSLSGNGFTNNTLSSIEGYSLESDSNNGKRIKIATKTNNGNIQGHNGFWTKKLSYNHNRKYYNLEADFEYINSYYQYLFTLRNQNFWLADQEPNIIVHYGGQNLWEQAQFLTSNNHSYGKFTYTNNGTFAFSLLRNEANTNDVFNVNYNGTNIGNGVGNFGGDNFFYILSTIYGSQYYLDNYKLYAPIVVDGTAFPEFTTDGEAVITSKSIKINFNDEIDSSAENLVNVKVTSMGSELSVTKSVKGKELTIAPTSGEFPFDVEITYDVNGIKNKLGSTATFTAKSFQLQKLWYETFDNATDITDLYGKYTVPSEKGQDFIYVDGKYDHSENLPTKTLQEFVETEGNRDVFTIVEKDGNKVLKMNPTGEYAFTHWEKYAGETAGRKIWTNTITEFDFETDADNASGFNYISPMHYASGSYNGASIGVGWQSGSNRKSFTKNDPKKFSMTAIRDVNSEGQYYTDFYMDGVFNSSLVTNNCKEGEFGFQNNSNSAVYLDNIKVYKVVDFTEDEHLWLTNTTATVSGNEAIVTGSVSIKSYSDKTVDAGNAIVVVYDSDEKIIGINEVTTGAVAANGIDTKEYTVTCNSTDVYRVSVFVWDSLSGMKPLIQNRTTTDITINK